MFRGVRPRTNSKSDRQRAVTFKYPASIGSPQELNSPAQAAPCTTASIIRTRIARTRSMSDEVDSGYGTDITERNRAQILEQSFEDSFSQSQQYAYAIVIQRLDLRRSLCGSISPTCSTCSEVLWKGHPVQEKLIRACHFYTMQWLAERDTTWWTDGLPARLLRLKNRGDVVQEPELVKAVGAWSLDLKSDRATDVLLSTSDVDTVPGANSGLLDAKLQALVEKTEESSTSVSSSTTEPQAGVDGVEFDKLDVLHVKPPVVVADVEEDNSSISEDSDEASTDSDFDLVEEQADRLLPTVITSLRTLTSNGSWTTSTAGSSFVSNDNTLSNQSQSSWKIGQANTHQNNGQKRKRDEQGNRDDDSDRDDGMRTIRTCNAMRLEDTSAKLACHFHTREKEKYCEGSANGKTYKTCAHGFKDSKDLRDHLKKKHYGPKWLCSRCYEVFDDCVQKAVHENAEQRCQQRRNEQLDRERFILVGTQRRVLFDKMKKPARTSHEEHWFDVWSVLFPGQPFPTTPYMPRDTFDVLYERVAEEVVRQMIDPSETAFVRRVLQAVKTRLREALDADQCRLVEQNTGPTTDAGQAEWSPVAAAAPRASLTDQQWMPYQLRQTPFLSNMQSNIEAPSYAQSSWDQSLFSSVSQGLATQPNHQSSNPDDLDGQYIYSFDPSQSFGNTSFS